MVQTTCSPLLENTFPLYFQRVENAFPSVVPAVSAFYTPSTSSTTPTATNSTASSASSSFCSSLCPEKIWIARNSFCLPCGTDMDNLESEKGIPILSVPALRGNGVEPASSNPFLSVLDNDSLSRSLGFSCASSTHKSATIGFHNEDTENAEDEYKTRNREEDTPVQLSSPSLSSSLDGSPFSFASWPLCRTFSVGSGVEDPLHEWGKECRERYASLRRARSSSWQVLSSFQPERYVRRMCQCSLDTALLPWNADTRHPCLPGMDVLPLWFLPAWKCTTTPPLESSPVMGRHKKETRRRAHLTTEEEMTNPIRQKSTYRAAHHTPEERCVGEDRTLDQVVTTCVEQYGKALRGLWENTYDEQTSPPPHRSLLPSPVTQEGEAAGKRETSKTTTAVLHREGSGGQYWSSFPSSLYANPLWREEEAAAENRTASLWPCSWGDLLLPPCGCLDERERYASSSCSCAGYCGAYGAHRGGRDGSPQEGRDQQAALAYSCTEAPQVKSTPFSIASVTASPPLRSSPKTSPPTRRRFSSHASTENRWSSIATNSTEEGKKRAARRRTSPSTAVLRTRERKESLSTPHDSFRHPVFRIPNASWDSTARVAPPLSMPCSASSSTTALEGRDALRLPHRIHKMEEEALQDSPLWEEQITQGVASLTRSLQRRTRRGSREKADTSPRQWRGPHEKAKEPSVEEDEEDKDHPRRVGSSRRRRQEGEAEGEETERGTGQDQKKDRSRTRRNRKRRGTKASDVSPSPAPSSARFSVEDLPEVSRRRSKRPHLLPAAPPRTRGKAGAEPSPRAPLSSLSSSASTPAGVRYSTHTGDEGRAPSYPSLGRSERECSDAHEGASSSPAGPYEKIMQRWSGHAWDPSSSSTSAASSPLSCFFSSPFSSAVVPSSPISRPARDRPLKKRNTKGGKDDVPHTVVAFPPSSVGGVPHPTTTSFPFNKFISVRTRGRQTQEKREKTYPKGTEQVSPLSPSPTPSSFSTATTTSPSSSRNAPSPQEAAKIAVKRSLPPCASSTRHHERKRSHNDTDRPSSYFSIKGSHSPSRPVRRGMAVHEKTPASTTHADPTSSSSLWSGRKRSRTTTGRERSRTSKPLLPLPLSPPPLASSPSLETAPSPHPSSGWRDALQQHWKQLKQHHEDSMKLWKRETRRLLHTQSEKMQQLLHHFQYERERDASRQYQHQDGLIRRTVGTLGDRVEEALQHKKEMLQQEDWQRKERAAKREWRRKEAQKKEQQEESKNTRRASGQKQPHRGRAPVSCGASSSSLPHHHSSFSSTGNTPKTKKRRSHQSVPPSPLPSRPPPLARFAASYSFFPLAHEKDGQSVVSSPVSSSSSAPSRSPRMTSRVKKTRTLTRPKASAAAKKHGNHVEGKGKGEAATATGNTTNPHTRHTRKRKETSPHSQTLSTSPFGTSLTSFSSSSSCCSSSKEKATRWMVWSSSSSRASSTPITRPLSRSSRAWNAPSRRHKGKTMPVGKKRGGDNTSHRQETIPYLESVVRTPSTKTTRPFLLGEKRSPLPSSKRTSPSARPFPRDGKKDGARVSKPAASKALPRRVMPFKVHLPADIEEVEPKKHPTRARANTTNTTRSKHPKPLPKTSHGGPPLPPPPLRSARPRLFSPGVRKLQKGDATRTRSRSRGKTSSASVLSTRPAVWPAAVRSHKASTSPLPTHGRQQAKPRRHRSHLAVPTTARERMFSSSSFFSSSSIAWPLERTHSKVADPLVEKKRSSRKYQVERRAEAEDRSSESAPSSRRGSRRTKRCTRHPPPSTPPPSPFSSSSHSSLSSSFLALLQATKALPSSLPKGLARRFLLEQQFPLPHGGNALTWEDEHEHTPHHLTEREGWRSRDRSEAEEGRRLPTSAPASSWYSQDRREGEETYSRSPLFRQGGGPPPTSSFGTSPRCASSSSPRGLSAASSFFMGQRFPMIVIVGEKEHEAPLVRHGRRGILTEEGHHGVYYTKDARRYALPRRCPFSSAVLGAGQWASVQSYAFLSEERQKTPFFRWTDPWQPLLSLPPPPDKSQTETGETHDEEDQKSNTNPSTRGVEKTNEEDGLHVLFGSHPEGLTFFGREALLSSHAFMEHQWYHTAMRWATDVTHLREEIFQAIHHSSFSPSQRPSVPSEVEESSSVTGKEFPVTFSLPPSWMEQQERLMKVIEEDGKDAKSNKKGKDWRMGTVAHRLLQHAVGRGTQKKRDESEAVASEERDKTRQAVAASLPADPSRCMQQAPPALRRVPAVSELYLRIQDEQRLLVLQMPPTVQEPKKRRGYAPRGGASRRNPPEVSSASPKLLWEKDGVSRIHIPSLTPPTMTAAEKKKRKLQPLTFLRTEEEQPPSFSSSSRSPMTSIFHAVEKALISEWLHHAPAREQNMAPQTHVLGLPSSSLPEGSTTALDTPPAVIPEGPSVDSPHPSKEEEKEGKEGTPPTPSSLSPVRVSSVLEIALQELVRQLVEDTRSVKQEQKEHDLEANPIRTAPMTEGSGCDGGGEGPFDSCSIEQKEAPGLTPHPTAILALPAPPTAVVIPLTEEVVPLVSSTEKETTEETREEEEKGEVRGHYAVLHKAPSRRGTAIAICESFQREEGGEPQPTLQTPPTAASCTQQEAPAEERDGLSATIMELDKDSGTTLSSSPSAVPLPSLPLFSASASFAHLLIPAPPDPDRAWLNDTAPAPPQPLFPIPLTSNTREEMETKEIVLVEEEEDAPSAAHGSGMNLAAVPVLLPSPSLPVLTRAPPRSSMVAPTVEPAAAPCPLLPHTGEGTTSAAAPILSETIPLAPVGSTATFPMQVQVVVELSAPLQDALLHVSQTALQLAAVSPLPTSPSLSFPPAPAHTNAAMIPSPCSFVMEQWWKTWSMDILIGEEARQRTYTEKEEAQERSEHAYQHQRTLAILSAPPLISTAVVAPDQLEERRPRSTTTPSVPSPLPLTTATKTITTTTTTTTPAAATTTVRAGGMDSVDHVLPTMTLAPHEEGGTCSPVGWALAHEGSPSPLRYHHQDAEEAATLTERGRDGAPCEATLGPTSTVGMQHQEPMEGNACEAVQQAYEATVDGKEDKVTRFLLEWLLLLGDTKETPREDHPESILHLSTTSTRPVVSTAPTAYFSKKERPPTCAPTVVGQPNVTPQQTRNGTAAPASLFPSCVPSRSAVHVVPGSTPPPLGPPPITFEAKREGAKGLAPPNEEGPLGLPTTQRWNAWGTCIPHEMVKKEDVSPSPRRPPYGLPPMPGSFPMPSLPWREEGRDEPCPAHLTRHRESWSTATQSTSGKREDSWRHRRSVERKNEKKEKGKNTKKARKKDQQKKKNKLHRHSSFVFQGLDMDPRLLELQRKERRRRRRRLSDRSGSTTTTSWESSSRTHTTSASTTITTTSTSTSSSGARPPPATSSEGTTLSTSTCTSMGSSYERMVPPTVFFEEGWGSGEWEGPHRTTTYGRPHRPPPLTRHHASSHVASFPERLQHMWRRADADIGLPIHHPITPLDHYDRLTSDSPFPFPLPSSSEVEGLPGPRWPSTSRDRIATHEDATTPHHHHPDDEALRLTMATTRYTMRESETPCSRVNSSREEVDPAPGWRGSLPSPPICAQGGKARPPAVEVHASGGLTPPTMTSSTIRMTNTTSWTTAASPLARVNVGWDLLGVEVAHENEGPPMLSKEASPSPVFSEKYAPWAVVKATRGTAEEPEKERPSIARAGIFAPRVVPPASAALCTLPLLQPPPPQPYPSRPFPWNDPTPGGHPGAPTEIPFRTNSDTSRATVGSVPASLNGAATEKCHPTTDGPTATTPCKGKASSLPLGEEFIRQWEPSSDPERAHVPPLFFSSSSPLLHGSTSTTATSRATTIARVGGQGSITNTSFFAFTPLWSRTPPTLPTTTTGTTHATTRTTLLSSPGQVEETGRTSPTRSTPRDPARSHNANPPRAAWETFLPHQKEKENGSMEAIPFTSWIRRHAGGVFPSSRHGKKRMEPHACTPLQQRGLPSTRGGGAERKWKRPSLYEWGSTSPSLQQHKALISQLQRASINIS